MPDLNSVPASPHSLATSRRQSSQQMPPPPPPSASTFGTTTAAPPPASPSLNILPSNQTTVNQANSTSSIPSPRLPPPASAVSALLDISSGAGSGPGPLRHPRPLTAADLHLELEKEQEAVVNRLTRELSLLRAAHNASVASNTSSTSATSGVNEPLVDTQHLVSGSGFSIPSSSDRRHQRTSSSASSRSLTANAGSTAGGIASVVGITGPAPIRPSGPHTATATPLSRQNSTASRRSRTGSPAPHLYGSQPHSYTHSYLADPATASYFNQRGPAPLATPGSASAASEISPGLMPGTSRYEETAFYRHELESVRRENETLKRRIRDLERQVRERRASDASRPRSESASTIASVSVTASGTGATPSAGGLAAIAGPRESLGAPGDRDRVPSSASTSGIREDEVMVGESAASSGLSGQENVTRVTR